MGTPDRLFSLYPRKRKSGKPTYYCRFRRPDGSWAAGKSTGQTSVGAAESWALEQIATGKVPATMFEPAKLKSIFFLAIIDIDATIRVKSFTF
jgi:hypothetical protein